MNSFKILKIALPFLVLPLFFFSCASQRMEEIRNTPTLQVQMLLTRNLMYYRNYNEAIEMFTYIKEQNPDNIAIKVEVDYEIAFCYWKKRDLKRSKELFEELIAFYDENTLGEETPLWPYNLSKKVLEDRVLPELEGK